MIKKINFLALCLALTVLCVNANAKDAVASEDDFKVKLTQDGTGALITKYVGVGGNVVIPDTIQGFPVKEIGNAAFENCGKLLSVKIPNSVTRIYSYAFNGCTNLERVEFPKNDMLEIGHRAFYGCNLLKHVAFYGEKYIFDADVFSTLETIIFEASVKEVRVRSGYALDKLNDFVFKSPNTVIYGDLGDIYDLPLYKQADIKKRTKGSGQAD